jgi:D-alanyl-D-alanine dipeptidase
LQAQGYGLKVFDCYRPSRAVADMGRFATEPGDPRKAEFYPRVDKQDFWRLGYVARVSNHSRGSTVDLTMTGPDALPDDTWTPTATAVDCTAPYDQRWHDGAVDMGTGFDCFDERAHTDSTQISATAKANRQRLTRAMEKEGFSGYSAEWWHFTYSGDATLKDVMDFPITPLALGDVLKTSNQLIVVTSQKWTDTHATAQRYERQGNRFRKYQAAFDVVLGKTGWPGARAWAPLIGATGPSNRKAMEKRRPGYSSWGPRLATTPRLKPGCLTSR